VRVGFAGSRGHLELLESGDVLSPWLSGFGNETATPSETTATVISNLRIVLLDRAFALRTGRWPEIRSALMRRFVVRVRLLGVQSAINAVPRYVAPPTDHARTARRDRMRAATTS
jgi:hypothetical protein